MSLLTSVKYVICHLSAITSHIVYGSVWMSKFELSTQNDIKHFWKREKANGKFDEISPYYTFVNENGLGATLKFKMFLGTKTHIICNKA